MAILQARKEARNFHNRKFPTYVVPGVNSNYMLDAHQPVGALDCTGGEIGDSDKKKEGRKEAGNDCLHTFITTLNF